MGLVQLFDDDLLELIFRNVQRQAFDARHAAEAQTSDDARDRWLRLHTVQEKTE
ncbi:MAG: hypothetical protein KAI41_12370 [Hyphomicrobiaceae bacterium]|nr:hypothetical protein [Hyphomicrobiaceae bacterium]